jgi:hypothetical protein
MDHILYWFSGLVMTNRSSWLVMRNSDQSGARIDPDPCSQLGCKIAKDDQGQDHFTIGPDPDPTNWVGLTAHISNLNFRSRKINNNEGTFTLWHSPTGLPNHELRARKVKEHSRESAQHVLVVRLSRQELVLSVGSLLHYHTTVLWKSRGYFIFQNYAKIVKNMIPHVTS